MDNFNCPISQTRLRQISNDACDSALATATAYNHAQTASWNDTIINSVLKALVSESQTAAATGSETRYKFCVNSTIIQHLSDPRPSGTTSTASAGTSTGTDAAEKTAGDAAVEGEAEEELKKEVGGEESGAAPASSSTGGPGRRGMHSASGAYWNNAKDGMWSHKYEGGEAKGMDIVIAIMWIAA
ncbi:hypothetical protein KC363_g2476 [Hortaea werneckii]|uniref:Dynein light chain n=1 Tax=Hortaea werneckii TaxID=91943 RepID=A0A3M7FWE2_HORWE|nr:hypothetical protein KC361_g3379 [Hortaea werneckii]KAI6889175.1 hypothetical protein KC325_g752 [Hortaea werneckii]KAI7001961.1 hypothetical protein KC359_g181 [Hortaea werneckii]KAI7088176.1 hypothetical protein KC356_g3502 [Hortaea werneckii]KAI7150182.1 hypothetical protein KC344_g286 [Hortaea werneckii]